MKNFFNLLLSLNYLDIHLALPYSSQCYISQQHKLTIIHFDLISICCTVSHINISKLQNETSAILSRNIPTHTFFLSANPIVAICNEQTVWLKNIIS